MFDEALGVKLVEYCIGVVLFAGSKHNNFVNFAHLLQETQRVRPDRDVSSLAFSHLDLYLTVRPWLSFTVHQSLIHIDYQHLFVFISRVAGQIEGRVGLRGLEGDIAAEKLMRFVEMFEGPVVDSYDSSDY